MSMRKFIDLLESHTAITAPIFEATPPSFDRKRRVTDAEFSKMAQDKLGIAKSAKMTWPEIAQFADSQNVQVPGAIRMNRALKVDVHHWNLSGRSADEADVDKKIAADTGMEVEPAAPEDDSEMRLANVRKVRNLVSTGKMYLMGRKPKGAFFRVHGAEELLAQLERALSRELEAGGDSSMEEQYNDLEEKIKLVGSGRSGFLKSLLITGAPSSGKALALDTPIPTPTGWTTMGELNVGDTIYDDKGEFCKVTFATPIQYNRNCYEVVFDDGTKIVADEDHRWFTTTVGSRQSERRANKRTGFTIAPHGTDQSYKRIPHAIVNTKKIANSIRCNDKFNHRIPTPLPIKGITNDNDLPINPYLLGLWLGDGCHTHATMSCGVQDIDEMRIQLVTENIEFKDTLTKKDVYHIQLSNGYGGPMKEKLRYKLRELGVLGNKHIPIMYLRASEDARMELLKGLMDTDGFISKGGNCEFCVTNKQLAEDFYDLIRGLGIKVGFITSTYKFEGREMGNRYRIHFTTNKDIFKLPRKKDRQKLTKKDSSSTIVACNPVNSVPVRCITVDSPSHLFLCSKSYIPTHNTYTVMQTIRSMGLKEGRDYIVKKGRITATQLYRVLIEQINGLTIFDDCDSVVEDKNGINMLKGALDTDPVREVSYDVRGTINVASLPEDERNEYCQTLSRAMKFEQTPEDIEYFKAFLSKVSLLSKALKGVKNRKSKGDDAIVDDDEDGIDDFNEPEETEEHEEDSSILNFVRTHFPNKIAFEGRIIFISNMSEDDWDSAILTRAFHQNMQFRDDEMLDYIDRIKGNIQTPNISDDQKQEVWDFVREMWKTGKLRRPVNFRLAQQAFDLRTTPIWQRLVSQL